MAFIKVGLPTDDSCFGVQRLTALQTNDVDLHSSIGLRHGTDDTLYPYPMARLRGFGRHNDPLIARQTTHIVVSSTFPEEYVQGLAFGFVSKISTGVWFFGLSDAGQSLGLYRCLVTPHANSSLVVASVTSIFSYAFKVTTRILSGGTFTPTDIDFDVTFFG